MRLSEAQVSAVFKVKIDIGDRMGQKRPEDAWVTLREPTYAELAEASNGGDDTLKSVENMSGLLPALIVAHNFEVTDGEKATPDQVAGILRSSATLFTYVLRVYQEALPLPKKTGQS